MLNPSQAVQAAKDIFEENPQKLEEWASRVDTDTDGVRKEIIAVAGEHGLKLNPLTLKMALAMGKQFLPKLSDKVRPSAEKIMNKLG